MVVTRTPLRISFVGGGTDLPVYYQRDFGAVLNASIDQYLYVTVKRHSPLFGEAIRLNYSESERVERVDELKHPIAREALKMFDIQGNLYISTVADLPGASGLGSSSSFAVGLLHAIHVFLGNYPTPGQLAEEAAHIEIDRLGRPIGKQDHYAAAFGGLNVFRFNSNAQVEVEPVRLEMWKRSQLFDHLLFFHTGLSRDAGEVLRGQKARVNEELETLTRMRDQVFSLRRILEQGIELEELGRILNEGWQMKRGLASGITNPDIDRWYRIGQEAGAVGGKLLGAGGGGFLMFVVPPDHRDRVREALSELTEVPVGFSPHGTQVIFNC
ncbi:MAG: GHMP kinase [Candidatus Omnitrophica bacterium]|nr:GHMP kinase [Candidatus Omnitrophota bacterium]